MRFPLILASVSALALAAGCTPEANVNASRVAGAGLDEGSFGNTTMNNHLVMTGQQNAVVNLSRQFAAEAPTMVNFEFNSSALDATARSALDQQAAWISGYPGVRFRVYGHTDKVGGNAFNRRLGQRRANTVVNYLVSRGISRSRLEAVVSFGETQPLVVTQGRERRNRRTVTEVSGFLKGRQQVQDGKYALFSYTETITSAAEPHDLVIIDSEGQAEER
ncbi:OmpA family protein [Actibacterium sp. 188UL27-1]|uniref:OmpA family protein n=1 Tax=Actibacterium sp. 188UL27-1 TaxID=2786961 RepID=UPI001958856A|nr:OmpA family protein [Actibacterium sp. 188UL27-1]MBM7068210.1 OmpA family protein [Actibacterium sp. 188UL27-1]